MRWSKRIARLVLISGSGLVRRRLPLKVAVGNSTSRRCREPQAFDAVIATVPSNVFSRLTADLPPDYQEKLRGLDYEAAVVVLLELDRPLTDIYWLNIADPELPFTAVIEHTNFVPASHYGGKHYVYLSKYLESDDEWFSLEDDELLARYEPHLRKLNPEFENRWIQRSWVFRERAAQPIIRMNYSDRIPEHQTPLAGVYLANTTQIYPEDRGTNYSVRLGEPDRGTRPRRSHPIVAIRRRSTSSEVRSRPPPNGLCLSFRAPTETRKRLVAAGKS